MTGSNIRRNVLTGILTVIPILVTLFVFSIFLDLLSDIGRPKVIVLSNAVRPFSPDLASWLVDVPWLSSALAIGLTLAMFYLLGWSMTRLVGRQLFHAVEHGLKRIPMVTTVYGATKKLIDAFRSDGGRAQRVVLIAFPHARMKAVGLVTRTFTDEVTRDQLAAVYVPTAPNPTGGYLEIVPVSELVPLDWTVDEAMAFVLSGGTTAPDPIRFNRQPNDRPDEEAQAESEGEDQQTSGQPLCPEAIPESSGSRGMTDRQALPGGALSRFPGIRRGKHRKTNLSTGDLR
jgi:uncharacterized membrane protein